MSLRDYYAAHADAPISFAREILVAIGQPQPTLIDIVKMRTEICYMHADEMLVQRDIQK